MKYGSLNLSAMTYTFKCDNEKCEKTIICIMTKYDESEYFGRCNYCNSGRLKWIQNINVISMLREQEIIHKHRKIKWED